MAQAELFQIWDEDGRRPRYEDNGFEMWRDEHEVRQMLRQRVITLVRSKRGRKLVWIAVVGAAKDKDKSPIKELPRSPKFCERETVGDIHRVFRHVGHRCSAMAPHRPPIDSSCL